MNEASQIVEQIAPKFNPIVGIDVWDAQNLDTPTRIPIKLLDISIENEDYEEYSSNICSLSMGISVTGNLYSPIQTTDRVKFFKMSINEMNGTTFNRRIIDNWDVGLNTNPMGGNLTNPVRNQIGSNLAPVIIDIVPSTPLTIGTTSITSIWTDTNNPITELTFSWVLLQGVGTIVPNLDKSTVTITASGTVEIQLTITDPFGASVTMNKIFTV